MEMSKNLNSNDPKECISTGTYWTLKQRKKHW